MASCGAFEFVRNNRAVYANKFNHVATFTVNGATTVAVAKCFASVRTDCEIVVRKRSFADHFKVALSFRIVRRQNVSVKGFERAIRFRKTAKIEASRKNFRNAAASVAGGTEDFTNGNGTFAKSRGNGSAKWRFKLQQKNIGNEVTALLIEHGTGRLVDGFNTRSRAWLARLAGRVNHAVFERTVEIETVRGRYDGPFTHESCRAIPEVNDRFIDRLHGLNDGSADDAERTKTNDLNREREV